MKKLMIAAAIVCAAVASQAATVTWNYDFYTSTGVYDGYNVAEGTGTSSTLVGADLKAYLVAYSSSFTQDDLLQAVRDGSDVATAAGANLLASSKTDASGLVKSAKWSEVLPEGEPAPSITAFLVVQNAAGDSIFLSAQADYTAAQDPLYGEVIPSTVWSRKNQDATGTKSYGSQGWYAVPEPTSGLLLLLGVAGLALRRRRA